MNEADKKLFSYYIIEFTDCKNSNNKFYVDLVPNSWIDFNDDKASGSVKYADPPYKINNCGTVSSMVKYDFRPIPFWKTYPIKVLKASGKYYVHNVN